MSKLLSWLFVMLTAIVFVGCNKEPIEEIIPEEEVPSNNKMLNLVNQYRKAGCKCGTDNMPPVATLTWNTALEGAAASHSFDMNKESFFSHTGSDGSTAGDRITKQGYTWKTWGENIGRGYTSEEAAMDGWINSPGHCKNIMDPDFKEMGAYRQGTYWTQVFAAR